MNSWHFLLLAGVLEIGFATTMKLSNGFKNVAYIPAFVVLAFASLYCLTKALTTIPVGTAYAIWTGIGAFGTAVLGIVVYKEPASFMRLFFLTMLIVSVIGLKFVSSEN